MLINNFKQISPILHSYPSTQRSCFDNYIARTEMFHRTKGFSLSLLDIITEWVDLIICPPLKSMVGTCSHRERPCAFFFVQAWDSLFLFGSQKRTSRLNPQGTSPVAACYVFSCHKDWKKGMQVNWLNIWNCHNDCKEIAMWRAKRESSLTQIMMLSHYQMEQVR